MAINIPDWPTQVKSVCGKHCADRITKHFPVPKIVCNCSSCLKCANDTRSKFHTHRVVKKGLRLCRPPGAFLLEDLYSQASKQTSLLNVISLSSSPSAEIVLSRYLFFTHFSWDPSMVMFGLGWVVLKATWE